MTQERKPRRGDVFELTLERFDERGDALGRVGEYALEIRRALPGERVRAEVNWRRRNTLGARVIERLEPSPHAVAAPCAHFGQCGGCSFQSLAYPAQLAGLHELVARAFRHQGFGAELEIAPVEGARELYGYRNKMEFTFSNRRWIDLSEPPGAESSFALGLHAPGMHSKVIDVLGCPIQPAALDAILATLRSEALARALSPWDQRSHTGLLRHAVLRSSRATGEILVDLVTSSDSPELVEPYAAAVLARHPEITTFVQNVNTRHAQTAQGEREHVLHGPGFIVERLLGLSFSISANSFFQTNPAQAERLFELVREAAGTQGGELVYDLYCGTGTIALVLAAQAREVLGFELAPSSVVDARANAERNGITNVSFVEGDVLASLASRTQRPDVVVVDPPRAGLHPKLLPVLAGLAPRRIVYVSCNPVSGARDARALAGLGYRAERVRPIDLFPHTPHVESVFALERAS